MRLNALPNASLSTSSPGNKSTYHIPDEEWRTLCGSLGIHTFRFQLKVLPLFILQHKLQARLEEISDDDKYLTNEGLNLLNLQECRDACLMRGLYEADISHSSSIANPSRESNENDEMVPFREALAAWLASPGSTALRSSTNLGSYDTVAAIYALARPELFVTNYRPLRTL
jgi:hypothetical protein